MTINFHRIAIAHILVALALATTAAQAQTPELLLFGGEDCKIFLGCLNCSRFDPDSVCNRSGDYGSCFKSKCIWNRFGDYGSPFGSYSPWNRFAFDPPVIVDREGNFYGYFTSNRYNPKRTNIKFFLIFLDNVDMVNEELELARDLFCNE